MWFLKIIAKLVLSRLPIGYSWWSYIGLFRHGQMDDFSYAWQVLKHHSETQNKKGWVGLELGPGDGLLSAFLAPVLGAKSLTLIDSGDFAHKDVLRYSQSLYNFEQKYPDADLPEDLLGCNNVDAMLSVVNGSYFTGSLSWDGFFC